MRLLGPLELFAGAKRRAERRAGVGSTVPHPSIVGNRPARRAGETYSKRTRVRLRQGQLALVWPNWKSWPRARRFSGEPRAGVSSRHNVKGKRLGNRSASSVRLESRDLIGATNVTDRSLLCSRLRHRQIGRRAAQSASPGGMLEGMSVRLKG